MTSAALAPFLAQAHEFVRRAKASNTVRAYRSDWHDFQSFCLTHERGALPATPETLAAYLADAAVRLKARTVERRLTAVSQAHQLAGVPNPAEDKLVRTVMAGIRRTCGTRQTGKDPLSPELLRQMFAAAGSDLRDVRDRALLLVGFAGAFRRSELVALRCEDLRFSEQGVIVTVPRSKTDPDGAGQSIGIPCGSREETCPVRSLRTWLKASGITSGFVFRPLGRWGREVGHSALCDHQLARIVKQRAQAAGLDPGSFSGHSLRSGLATSAAAGGASERSIMDQTRHRSLKQVRVYIRRGMVFEDNAAARSGL